jgi:hypothetical protein
MLIVKGYRVSFVMAGGRAVKPPASYALMNDESGSDWPRCSGLVGPIKSTSRRPISNSAAKSYFGHQPYDFRADIPSGDERHLRNWKYVGELEKILYTRRRANRAPTEHADDYFHPIRQDGPGILAKLLSFVLPAGAKLYRRGRWYRMELASGCTWNWRGIVSP